LQGEINAIMAKVFISYSSQDAAFADQVYTALEEAGHQIWMDRESLRGGEAWLEVIQNNILWADTMVVVWSANAVASRWVLDELTFAHATGKQIIPLQIDDTDPSRNIIINARQVIDARGQLELALRRLEIALTQGYVPANPPDDTLSRAAARRARASRPMLIVTSLVLLALVVVALIAFARPDDEPLTVTTLTVPGSPPATTQSATQTAPAASPTPDRFGLETLNQWRADHQMEPLANNATLGLIADRHMRDLRSRPLFESWNEYRDAEGRDVAQMAAEAAYNGQVEMVVKITDEPLTIDELLDEMNRRGGEEVHTAYSEGGLAWVRALATGKYYYVLVLGEPG
jgi:hypothetical protein